MKTEFDCQRCGIHVIYAHEVQDDVVHCVQCTFILEIQDPESQKRVEAFMNRLNEDREAFDATG